MIRLILISFLFPTLVQAATKELVYCSAASPLRFNPQLATDGASFNITRSIYDKLISFEPDKLKVAPGLAKSWKVSKDGKSIDFLLRDDVHFHTTANFKPTRKLNADDVLFSFNRMRLKKHPFHKVGGGNYKYFRSMGMPELIQDIRKINNHQVRITLSRPEAPIIANLAMEFASILSKEYADKLLKEGKKELIDTMPVGTGAFVFQKYNKDDSVLLAANKKYFRGPAKADKVTVKIIVSADKRIQSLLDGECHFVNSPPPKDLPKLESQKKIRVMNRPGLNVFYLAFNTRIEPYNNSNFRKAVHHALNRRKIVDVIFKGQAQVAKNPIPPIMWAYNRGIQDHEYNPSKAKEYLKKVKLPKGFKARLWYMTETRSYNPDGKAVADIMKADLESIGMKVELVTKSWSNYLSDAYEGQFEMLQLGWTGDNGDPDNFLYTLLSCAGTKGGNNYSGWCNQKYTHLVSRARVTTDIRRRTGFYEKAQEIFKQESPWVTLVHAKIYKAMLKDVVGYRMTPFGHDYLHNVGLKSWESAKAK